jgi:hypothetical protein
LPGTGYVSIADYLGANQGTLAREGQDVGGAVQGEIDAAKKAADGLGSASTPGDYTTRTGYGDALSAAQTAQQDATGLGSESGLQGLLQKQQGGPYQGAAFDAALLSSAGGFGGVQTQARGLSDYLAKAASTPVAAPAPAPAGVPRPPRAPADPGEPQDPYDPADPGGPLKPPKPPRPQRPGRTPFGEP